MTFLGGLAVGCMTAMIINKKASATHHQKIKDLVADTEAKISQIRSCMASHIEHCKVDSQSAPQPSVITNNTTGHVVDPINGEAHIH